MKGMVVAAPAIPNVTYYEGYAYVTVPTVTNLTCREGYGCCCPSRLPASPVTKGTRVSKDLDAHKDSRTISYLSVA